MAKPKTVDPPDERDLYPPDERNVAASHLVRKVISARPDYFAALVQRLDELRLLQRGQPRLWVQVLGDQWSPEGLVKKRVSSEALAGAIFSHLIRAWFWWTADEYDTKPPPRLSWVGSALGADLLGYDYDEEPAWDLGLALKIGAQLLYVARDVGIINLPYDDKSDVESDVEGDVVEGNLEAGYRIHINDELVDFLINCHAEGIEGIQQRILRRRPSRRPTKVRPPRRPHDMLINRPDAPPSVRKAVNKLQGTAWRINRRVLEVIGTKEATLHFLNGFADYREGIRKSATRQWTLREADVLAELDHFYIPMHLDFRGRVHQGGGLLTYTGGSDTARGLLEFADGEILDKEGIEWLTWHAAQMWGHDLPDMRFGDGTPWLHSFMRPTAVRHGKTLRFDVDWQKAKEPVQFLAAMFALEDAFAGRPVHLPVRVDASCSGLQHLALLARDEKLAKMVNLWGDDKYANYDRRIRVLAEGPQMPDFYTLVADKTGFERGEVKAVVVPLLYNAGDKRHHTLSKKLAQARRGDRARFTQKDTDDVEVIKSTAEKLAEPEFKVLRWFTKVANAHNRKRAEVLWTVPSGFNGVQDYRWSYKQKVTVYDGSYPVGLILRFPTETLDTVQQVTSLPSSIVHSLDASLLTEIVARSPISHWAVAHDAFAVPANRMWDLLRVNEEAVKVMYEADRLAEWTEAWRQHGVAVPDPPKHDAELPPQMLKGLRTIG